MQSIHNPHAGQLHDIIEADTLKDDDAALHQDDAERQALEEEVRKAALALLAHMGAGAFLLPLHDAPGGRTSVVVGEPQSIRDMAPLA